MAKAKYEYVGPGKHWDRDKNGNAVQVPVGATVELTDEQAANFGARFKRVAPAAPAAEPSKPASDDQK